MSYNAQYSLVEGSSNRFWAQGGSVELGNTFYHGLGIAMKVTGTTVANVNASGEGLSLVTATFGPLYTWTVPRRLSSSREVKLFGEGLLGTANGLNSVFPSRRGLCPRPTAWLFRPAAEWIWVSPGTSGCG